MMRKLKEKINYLKHAEKKCHTEWYNITLLYVSCTCRGVDLLRKKGERTSDSTKVKKDKE